MMTPIDLASITRKEISETVKNEDESLFDTYVRLKERVRKEKSPLMWQALFVMCKSFHLQVRMYMELKDKELYRDTLDFVRARCIKYPRYIK